MGVEYLERESLPKLAYVYTPAKEGVQAPTVVFCGGYRSDMNGTKALYLEEQCRERGQAYLRFDYSGHGQSAGEFVDGTIGSWFADALAIFDQFIENQAVIVGSSMGGWIGLLMAGARSSKVVGYVGIAAAPDFTKHIFEHDLNDQQRETLLTTGILEIPNDYSDVPYTYTKAFYEDGEKYLLLDRHHRVDFPIRLLHGRLDKDVQEFVPEKICELYEGDVQVTYIDDGDHRLSRPVDLEAINDAVIELSCIDV